MDFHNCLQGHYFGMTNFDIEIDLHYNHLLGHYNIVEIEIELLVKSRKVVVELDLNMPLDLGFVFIVFDSWIEEFEPHLQLLNFCKWSGCLLHSCH